MRRPPAHVRVFRGILHGAILGLLFYLIVFAIGVTAARSQTLDMVGARTLVSPTRIVLTGGLSAGRFLLINHSQNSVTYAVSFIPLMKHERAGAMDIGPDILVAPRRVTLRPGGVQYVRFLLMKPPAGKLERARIKFAPVAPEKASDEPRATKVTAGVKIMVGLTLPIERRP